MITDHTPTTLRAFEAEIADLFNAGQIRAPVHLSAGNEEQLIEIFRDIQPKDWVCGSWRSHLHCLLKGVPPAELRTAILAGRSITLCFPEYRIVTSAIVGGILPIATGIAIGIKRRGGAERAWAFMGDMTARTGMAHECIEYAYGEGLPITFVEEDNGLSVCTPTRETWRFASAPVGEVKTYNYDLAGHWPHAGAGKRISF